MHRARAWGTSDLCKGENPLVHEDRRGNADAGIAAFPRLKDSNTVADGSCRSRCHRGYAEQKHNNWYRVCRSGCHSMRMQGKWQSDVYSCMQWLHSAVWSASTPGLHGFTHRLPKFWNNLRCMHACMHACAHVLNWRVCLHCSEDNSEREMWEFGH